MTDDFYLYKPTAKSHFKLSEPILSGCVGYGVGVGRMRWGGGGGGVNSSFERGLLWRRVLI